MNHHTIKAITWISVIIFSLVTVLCPIAYGARNKKNDPKARQAVKNESKQAAGEDEKKDSRGDTAKNDTHVNEAETDKNETQGIPTKDYKEEDFKPAVEEESFAWMFVKMLLILGIFAGGFYYFYRFVSKKGGVSIFGSEAIKVLSVVPLGQNKYLNVVDLAGKIVVIGVSDNNINLITEITEKDQIDRIRILSTRRPPPAERGGGGFQDLVLRQIGKIVEKVHELKNRDRRFKSMPAERPSDVEYLRRQRDRLKNLNGVDDE
jgi:flagellar protein FliO/FliZ